MNVYANGTENLISRVLYLYTYGTAQVQGILHVCVTHDVDGAYALFAHCVPHCKHMKDFFFHVCACTCT